ncbi:MAG: Ig-like domain-containing protein, partial [Candidatus Buchananbacteria bacterium]
KIKSRNPSDAAHALSSESNYSSEAAISNTAPVINIISASQQLNSNYVLISYSGTDGQNDTNNLNAYEYSTDHSTWHAMTEKAGVGSSGKNNLIFSSAGSAYVFAWDAAADLPNQENLTVYVRLKSNDGITDSNLAESSAFYVDTLGPVISNINFAQAPTTGLVTISYNLNDNSGAGNDIVMSISGDGGGTWTVSTSTLSGDVGSGVTAGANRQATWQAFTDYSGQENNTIKIKIFGLDKYGNSGSSTVSDNFTLDTKAPAVSSVSASQISGTGNVLINYTLADLTSAGHLVEFGVSADNGGTWAVATSTVSGSIGAGQSVGAKSFTWQASTDYSGYDVTNMKIRVRAKDYFGNQSGFISSASFSLDTKAPVISNISATQQGGSDLFTVNYDLDDQATTTLNISSDGGLTWAVSTLSAAGDLGNNLAAGVNKSISWNGAADYIDHENSNMRARLKATDSHGNASIYYESANFALDTAAPLNLIALNKFGTNNNNVTLTWPVASDANFSHYELWHGANENDVINQTSTANLWGVVNDANLSNVLTISTTITGLNLTSSYFVRIWAVDNFGHRAAANQINVFTQPVSTPTPAATPVQTAGGMAYLPDSTAPIKPLLNPVVSPSQNPILEISGLSEPGSRLELYDNDSLLAGFSATAAANGAFQQSLNLIQGSHRLKVRAYDAAGNVSEFSDSISVDIIFGVAAPLIISPKTEENVTDTNPTIFGVSIPFATINIILDSGQKFTASADGLGAWNFKLPTTLALSNGQHNFVITASDQAGNVSLPTNLALTKTTLAATAGIGIQTPAPVSPITPTPLAPSELISQNAEAIELPGLPLPKVNLVQIPAASSDIITFSGTALPNQDVIVYVHSSQALIYRTRTDGQGNWRVDHSQKLMALAPGDHTVFAVTLDAAAKVKSRPSAISIFTVKRNLWVQIFNYLNLQTTIVALAVMLLTWLWLYRSRKTLLSKGIS